MIQEYGPELKKNVYSYNTLKVRECRSDAFCTVGETNYVSYYLRFHAINATLMYDPFYVPFTEHGSFFGCTSIIFKRVKNPGMISITTFINNFIVTNGHAKNYNKYVESVWDEL